jgi:CheY-like chemotaxis protein
MGKSRILIVEDNPDNLELVRFLINQAGHQVLAATDGRKGLALARQQLPDLILLDLGMPELDGWSVAEELKKDPLTNSIPVVAITAYTLPGDRRRAIEAGCDGYISKPLNVSTFIEEISQYLKNPPVSPDSLPGTP